ncbi:MAG TPA: uL22 family ribosomal protein [Candidatus Pacearchaeota archaeon]|nr:uL22 family ribosomal protein [Candidatus Pacearchaeota archaeon]
MAEQKEIDNQKLKEVKKDELVEEVKATEDIKEMEDKNMKDKKEEKKDKKKVKTPAEPNRSEAVVNGRDLRISTKHSVAVCNFIKNKNIDDALAHLEEVSKMKRAIPMRGEIPHRKGKMMSGRYPLNAVKVFILLLKSLKANAINHELELEKVKLACMANVASRPMKRFGQGKHKRSHVQIKLIPMGAKKK